MTSSKRDVALTAAGVLAILARRRRRRRRPLRLFRPGDTTTVVRDVGRPARSRTPSATSSASRSTTIYQRTHQGVVDITVDAVAAAPRRSAARRPPGRGLRVGSTTRKGDIVTNEHVVSGATSITVTFWNGKTYKGQLVGSDSSTDLAVVRISAPASMLHPAHARQLGRRAGRRPGRRDRQPVRPRRRRSRAASSARSRRSIDAPNNFTIGNAIQTDAPINHGNSGGPLLNSAGQVIGVNAQIQSDSGGSEGVGFAIPSNTVRSIVSQIVAGKTVAHAYLGVRVRDSSSPLGATLAQVLPGTPAAKAGLESGDVVVEARRQGDPERRRRLVGHRRQEARRHDEGHLRPQAARPRSRPSLSARGPRELTRQGDRGHRHRRRPGGGRRGVRGGQADLDLAHRLGGDGDGPVQARRRDLRARRRPPRRPRLRRRPRPGRRRRPRRRARLRPPALLGRRHDGRRRLPRALGDPAPGRPRERPDARPDRKDAGQERRRPRRRDDGRRSRKASTPPSPAGC